MGKFFRNNGFAAIMMIVLVLMAIINSDFLDDPIAWFFRVLTLLPGIVLGITIHEFAHAFTAYKLGDNTAKREKRVSLNPIRHIDPIGFVALFLVGFGWGKPVPVNPHAFKHPRRDNLLVDVAGVITNFILAFLLTGALKLFYDASTSMNYHTFNIISEVLVAAISINLVLMIFNLLPVPPLDGFGVVTEVFNLRNKPIYYQIYNAGMPILLLLVVFNIPSRVISPIVSAVSKFLFSIFF
ncbi:MAG: site-2 protease family protein [Clostridiales Family XIII bacterium]|jgi:Zn-dependent protease|nr:site-2 protease family protein [Clostridiales Family XIII bacterium]